MIPISLCWEARRLETGVNNKPVHYTVQAVLIGGSKSGYPPQQWR